MPENHWLSNEGQQRREQILALAIKEAEHRRRKRVVLTTGVTFVGLLLVGGILFTLMPVKAPRTSIPEPGPIAIKPSTGPSPSTVATLRPVPVPAPPAPRVIVEQIPADPHILEKLTIRPEPPRWTTLSDAELLDLLAANNQRAAIGVVDGDKVIVSY